VDPRNYEDIKALAKELGWKVEDVVALSPGNDPYYAGSPAGSDWAQWFLSLLNEFKDAHITHLRRFHYLVVNSGRNFTLPDGSPYENTDECWRKLQDASASARHLNLVDPLIFNDHRTPDPSLHAGDPDMPSEPGYTIDETPRWVLPSIPTDLARQVSLEMPTTEVDGYEYCQSDQPYLVEVWIEKSGENDVLDPICRRLHVNFVPGIGFMSITSTIKLLKRIQRIRDVIGEHKPARIFYISDFDPAGVAMPISVARHLEFYLRIFAPGSDIKLTPLALTEQQVRDYDLPRIPIKEEDRRKGNFEDRRGEGAVELDALEGLHPGALGRIVREAIEPYVDQELVHDLSDAEDEARAVVKEAWEEATQEEEAERQAIDQEARAIAARYEERAKQLNDEMQAELAPLRERIKATRQAIDEKASQMGVQLPERPVGSADGVDEDDWLFDSGRGYLEQLSVYRKFQKKTEDPAGEEKQCEAPGCTARFKTRSKIKLFCSPECKKAVRRKNGKARMREYRARKKADEN
jgi:hypothetical protein